MVMQGLNEMSHQHRGKSDDSSSVVQVVLQHMREDNKESRQQMLELQKESRQQMQEMQKSIMQQQQMLMDLLKVVVTSHSSK